MEIRQQPCKVSVIVPVYKVEAYLPRCIESLRSQTLRELEIILVDDGSPDGCPRICDEYAAKDSRIRVLHKENAGALLARQSGLEIASAPYVGFVDSDDFVSPDMFETLWQEAVSREAQVVCCSMVHYWSGEKQCPDTRAQSLTGFYSGEKLEDFYRRFFFDNTPRAERESIVPALWNKLFQRELILECHRRLTREWTGIRIGEDMLISYSCLLLAQRISVLGDFYPVYYVYRPESVMNSFKPGFLQNTEILLSALDALPLPPQARQPVQDAIRRYASYTALRIAQNIVPPDASLWEKQKATAGVVKHLTASALWKEKLCKSGRGVFRYRSEKLMYVLLKMGMGRSFALCDWLHGIYKKRKEKGSLG